MLEIMLLHYLPHLSKKRIVLASQSPRRAEILQLMGLSFQVRKSEFAEDLPKDKFGSAADYATATAREKALDVQRSLRDSKSDKNNGIGGEADVVIAADTIVVLDGDILEKPTSEGDAIRMLRALSARQHTVFTGVCLVLRGGDVRSFNVGTDVWFDELCDDVLRAYVRSREPMDKAGAYGIQGLGGAFVSRIDGCYFTVMGLPMHALAKEMRKLIDDGLL